MEETVNKYMASFLLERLRRDNKKSVMKGTNIARKKKKYRRPPLACALIFT